jgi:glycosyltransferase involved in cell wall biosynthesis
LTDKPIILHIVKNQVAGDSRVLRALSAISDAFPNHKIVCAGYANEGSNDFKIGQVIVNIVDAGAWTSLPKLFARFMKYLTWHYQCVKKFGTQPIAVVHCHELVPLMISLHLKLRTGCEIIYDAHELETECRTNSFDKTLKPVLRIVERLGIKYSAKVITVSNSIGSWYEKNYPQSDVATVFNCPDDKSGEKIKLQPLKDKKNLAFIYCGAIVPGRGIELYLETFSQQVNKNLYFLGDGLLLEEVLDYCLKYSNIEYIGKVEPRDVVNELKKYDVSLCMIEDVTLTSRYCMPNKLFESVVAGIPTIVSDLPDLRQFVSESKTGWVVQYDQKSFSRFIEQLDLSEIEELADVISDISHNFSWTTEKVKLIKIYHEILMY